jgi:integrase
MVQRYYNGLFLQGTSSSIIHNLNEVLKIFFNYAIKEGYILSNPCNRVIIPSEKKIIDESDNSIDPFSMDEIDKILIAAKSKDYFKMLVQLGFATGLRKGELLGLTIKDIDLSTGELRVSKALKSVKIFDSTETFHRETLVSTPKTNSSIRTVPIPSVLIPVLKSYFNKQKEKYFLHQKIYNDSSYVFTTEYIKPLDGKNILRMWKRTLNRAGVRYRNFHNIRHTYASQMFDHGVELLTVSRLLGHSNIAMTADIYTHIMPHQKINAAEKINHLFSS